MPTDDPMTMAESPLRTLRAWIDEARALGLKDPDAMTLATVGDGGRPSARIVLCRLVDDESLTFFTNYESRKGSELAVHPDAAAVFYWRELDRQVRVEGQVARASREVSDAYFATRARGSQIAARVSPQSREIASMDDIHARHAALDKELEGSAVERPDNWGGYRLTAAAVELWRAGEFRVHDRLRYERRGAGWAAVRLAP
jgi:pyridoxamine 5'-phosphate oxidase